MSSAGDPVGRGYAPRTRVPDTVAWREAGHQNAPLPVSETFAGTRLVVVGGTGFLGKVLLSLMLAKFPDIKHIFLMVRPRKGLTPLDRFHSEIWPTPVFDAVRDGRDDDEVKAEVLKRLTPIAGDVTHARAGVDDETLKMLLADGGIDAVLNVSGVVSFTPPIDEGFRVNANGVTNLIQLSRDLAGLSDDDTDNTQAVPLLHTSTCYVAGGRTGRVFEDPPDVHPFPRSNELDRSHWSPEREVEEGLALASHIRERAEDAQLRSQVEESVRKKLRSKGQPTTGPAFDEGVKKEKRKTLDKMLVDAGTERAAHWGWPNTYTYTKSVGEQLLHKSGVPYTIVRPAVVESSLAFPFPGWNEGINTSAPLIYMALHGHVNYPTVDGHVLDVIPVDQVCFGTLLAAAALLRREQDSVYQLGTSDANALTMNRLIELTGLYKRRFMRSRNRGNPLLNRLYARVEPIPVAPSTYKSRSAPAISKAITGATGLMKALKGTPAAPVARTVEKQLTGAKRGVDGAAMVMNAFLPFISELDYRFRCDNTRALMTRVEGEDRDKLPFAPEAFDWREYWLDIHIKGLRKWVFPHLDARLMKRPRADERFSDLVSFLEEVGEREGSHPALQRLKHAPADGGEETLEAALEQVSYRELLRRAKSTASRLADVGVHPGDRVGLLGKNSPEWAIGFFGILFAGGSVVTLDSSLDRHTLGERMSRVGVEFVLLDADVEAVEEAACLDLEEFTSSPPMGVTATVPEILLSPDDVAAIVFTSGTTGTPKPVTLTHKNITTVLASVAPLFKLSRRDTSLSVMPLHTSFELTCGLLLPLLRGATVTYVDEVTADSLSEAFRVAGISAMVGVPQVWEDLEAEIHDELSKSGPFAEAAFQAGLVINKTLGKTLGLNLGRLLFRPVHDRLGGKVRFMVSSGGHLPKKTADTFAALGIETKQAYGLTEGAPLLTVGDARGQSPVPGIEVEVRNVDDDGVGEIVTRGDNVMLGYHDDDEATERAFGTDGWLRTGDLGRIDKKGRITVVARDNEVIVRADGRKVYPREVEEVLCKTSGVVEAAVVGVPDGRGGERAEALVVVEKPARPKGADDDTYAQLCASALEVAKTAAMRSARKLDAAYRPETILTTFDSLPRTSERKLKRTDVIAILVAEQARRPKAVSPDVVDDQAEPSVALAVPRTRERLAAPGRGKKAKKKDVADAVETALPPPVQDAAKRVLGAAQMGFYDRFMNVDVEGEAHLPHNRPTIIAANHASHLDMGLIKYALGSYGQNLVTLAAKDYFFDGRWRRVYFENLTNLRPLDRSDNPREAMREASALLEQGKTVLLFPEGTRTSNGEMASFRPAITYLALKHGVDILPVFVGGTYRSMPRGSFFPRNRNVNVKIGAPISVEMLQARTDAAGLRLSQACAKTAEVVQMAVESLRDEKTFDVERVVDETLGLKEKDESAASNENPLNDLFGYLQGRFQKDAAADPVTYYFSLGAGPETKWTVKVDKENCEIVNDKAGSADCIMKTDIPMFTKIVKDKYIPEIGDFMDGTIKTNDPELLLSFVQVFNL